MHTTPGGRISAKFSPQRTWKRHLKIEKVARLAMAGIYTDAQIAASQNISAQTVAQLKSTQEYHAKMIELKTGVISDLDKNMREIRDNQVQELASMVPMALLGLRDSLLSSNPHIRLRACAEVLDRDGELAKVSKSQIELKEKPDLAKTNASAIHIMALLNGQYVGVKIGEEKENNSLEGFTLDAKEASEQVKRMEAQNTEKTLEALEIKTKVQ